MIDATDVKHTQGTLVAAQGFEDEPDRWVVTTREGYVVAMIHNGAPGDTMKTEGANAKLFAASPDLLTAAKRALSILRAQGESVRPGNVLGALDAAIAKATGANPHAP